IGPQPAAARTPGGCDVRPDSLRALRGGNSLSLTERSTPRGRPPRGTWARLAVQIPIAVLGALSLHRPAHAQDAAGGVSAQFSGRITVRVRAPDGRPIEDALLRCGRAAAGTDARGTGRLALSPGLAILT